MKPWWLLALVICLMPAANAQKVNPDSIRLELEAVMITATRIPRTLNEQNRVIRIISRDEIRQYPVRDLNELLEMVPGIDIRQRGPMGVQADIGIRGSSFDQVSILVNGVDVSDPQTGHFSLNVPVPLQMIDRIEVLTGFGARQIGAASLAGAVNIITREPSRSAFGAGYSTGAFRSHDLFAQGGMAAKDLWQRAGVSWQKSDGFAENTDYRSGKAFYQAGFKSGSTQYMMQAGWLIKDFGAQAFYTPLYPNQYEEIESSFTSLRIFNPGKIPFNIQIYHRSHTDRFHLFRSDPPAWYQHPNYHFSQTAGTKTGSHLRNRWGEMAIGMDFRYDWIWSTVLGEEVTESRPIRGYPDLSYNHFGTRLQGGLSLEQRIQKGSFAMSGGLMANYYSLPQNPLRLFPGIDMAWSIAPGIKLTAVADRTFRTPTFTELYYRSPTHLGNPALYPEVAWNLEGGVQYEASGLLFQASAFSRLAGETIDWVRLPGEILWQSANLGNLNSLGGELNLRIKTGEWSGQHRRPMTLQLGTLYQVVNRRSDEWISKYLLDHLRWKWSASVHKILPAGFRLVVAMQGQQRTGSYTYYEDGVPLEKAYAYFWLLDMKLSKTFRWFELFVEGSNLLNRSYLDYGGVPQPGRWIWGGIRADLAIDQ